MEQIDFQALERELIDILDDLQSVLLPSERAEVVEFVEVGEYGVALETLSAVLVEERKSVPRSVFVKMNKLADVMDIRKSTITVALKGQVSGD